MLVLAGPYEFLADDPWLYGAYASEEAKKGMPTAPEAQTSFAAHKLLRVDAGWLSEKAAAWFKQATGALPPGYSVVRSSPVSLKVDTSIGTVGIVLFPEGPIQGKSPTPEQEQSALAAGRALKQRCSIIVGISPWGFVGERDFLPKADGIFNVIMGGGEGVGFSHTVTDKRPDILWLRPDTQGRAVNILEILELPKRGATFAWRENTTFRARLEWLDDSYPPDSAMLKIVGSPE